MKGSETDRPGCTVCFLRLPIFMTTTYLCGLYLQQQYTCNTVGDPGVDDGPKLPYRFGRKKQTDNIQQFFWICSLDCLIEQTVFRRLIDFKLFVGRITNVAGWLFTCHFVVLDSSN